MAAQLFSSGPVICQCRSSKTSQAFSGRSKMISALHSRRRPLMLAAVAVLFCGLGNEQTLADDRAVDREQISTILSRWEDAWNRHDMRAFASQFHEDGVWVLWTGDVWR